MVHKNYLSGVAASWPWVTEKLKQDFHCIALELPGFGDAPPLDEPTLQNYGNFVCDAIACLGIERFVLIGHSMGGKIALRVAADDCPELEQVILVAPVSGDSGTNASGGKGTSVRGAAQFGNGSQYDQRSDSRAVTANLGSDRSAHPPTG